MKRRRIFGLIVLVVLVALGAGAYFLFYGTVSGAVHDWINHEVRSVAADYLNPTLTFKDLRYVYPLTAVIDQPRLVSPDPAKPGATVDIFAAHSITLEMAEIPRPGQPLRITKLTLDHPELCVVTTPSGSIIGFGDFLKSQPGQAGAPPTPLTSIFEIRLIELKDGLAVYDPRRPGTKPMQIDHITTHLTVEPSAAEPGWYALAVDLDRKPVFATHFDGRVNLDTMLLDAHALRVDLKLGRDQDAFLPPELQEILKRYEVTGALALQAHGSIPVTDPTAATVDATLSLAGGNVSVGEHRLAIEKLDVRCRAADRHLNLDELDAQTLGGTLAARGQVSLAAPMTAQLDATCSGLRLEQALRNPAGEDSQFRGAIDGHVTWQSPLATVTHDSRGSGEVRVTEGRLDAVPVLGQVLGGLRSAMAVTHVVSSAAGDTAAAVFTFQGDRVNCSSIDLVMPWAAGRGTGDIYMNGRLDLVINAGPLEKIESLLGKPGELVSMGKKSGGPVGDILGAAGSLLSKGGELVGKVAGKVTDQIAAYTVTGTFDDVKVGVRVAPGLSQP